MELVKDRKDKAYATEETVLFMDKCREKGVLVGKGGLMGNVIRLAPPLTISAEQVDELLEVFDHCFAEITPSG
jgi:4-aminobutyrate aminotransferase-like enzyme